MTTEPEHALGGYPAPSRDEHKDAPKSHGGEVVVPREPTDEMLIVGAHAIIHADGARYADDAAAVWKAMLSAVPLRAPDGGALAPLVPSRENDALSAKWQPIETAPRDGTRVLFWDARRKVAVSGCWHVEPGMDTPNAYEPGWAWWTADDDLITWDGGPDDAPIHWMPLPPPPARMEGEG